MTSAMTMAARTARSVTSTARSWSPSTCRGIATFTRASTGMRARSASVVATAYSPAWPVDENALTISTSTRGSSCVETRPRW
ncbi:hypothetical protein DQ384_20220 [Sphaerisporangium album]|uniref:Uncharacterized protein n=1 Tax=Sphaerisporangium album TaxID=509200 RepID=A0A367FG85_9ACTN|nr:hypothetical protein DQ384_20220 [Sphaerisporangium album]